jgi:hypothetical protein
MSLSVVGLFAGLLLTLIAAVAGLGWLLLAVLLAAEGAVGRVEVHPTSRATEPGPSTNADCLQ